MDYGQGTQEEAVEAYDVATIKIRGVNVVTNFDISRYDVERIIASTTLLVGELAMWNKTNIATNVEQPALLPSIDLQQNACALTFETIKNNSKNPENQHQLVNNELLCEKIGMQHSNPSSLIISLSCPKEKSPDGISATMGATTIANMSSWVSLDTS